MNFLILYSTEEGHTHQIAQFVRDELEAMDFNVQIKTVSEKTNPPTSVDAVIVAAPIHGGQYPAEMVDFISQYSKHLNVMPTLFLSVGLMVRQTDPQSRKQLADTTNDFLNRTRWTPYRTVQIAGALLYTRYGFFKRMLMRSIMRKAGGDIDTKRDYIYTDWDALKITVDDFVHEFQTTLA